MNARRRATAVLGPAILLGLVGLAACPLPQPLPEVGRADGGTETVPPRILVGTAAPADTVIAVSRNCPGTPRFELQAQIDDVDTTEQVEARWFVDYDPRSSPGIWAQDFIPGSGDPAATVRAVPAFGYDVPPPDAANTVHVVELVVSNGFAASSGTAALPNRTPADGYEVQVFRWVFQYTDGAGRCQYP